MLNPAPSAASGGLFDMRPRPSLTCEEAATLARVRGGRARLEAMERCEAPVVGRTGSDSISAAQTPRGWP